MKTTIIIATYNRAHFIKQTLNSILAQTYSNWECLIIDDGGTDNTLEVITPILNKIIDLNIKKEQIIIKRGYQALEITV